MKRHSVTFLTIQADPTAHRGLWEHCKGYEGLLHVAFLLYEDGPCAVAVRVERNGRTWYSLDHSWVLSTEEYIRVIKLARHCVSNPTPMRGNYRDSL